MKHEVEPKIKPALSSSDNSINLGFEFGASERWQEYIYNVLFCSRIASAEQIDNPYWNFAHSGTRAQANPRALLSTSCPQH